MIAASFCLLMSASTLRGKMWHGIKLFAVITIPASAVNAGLKYYTVSNARTQASSADEGFRALRDGAPS